MFLNWQNPTYVNFCNFKIEKYLDLALDVQINLKTLLYDLLKHTCKQRERLIYNEFFGKFFLSLRRICIQSVSQFLVYKFCFCSALFLITNIELPSLNHLNQYSYALFNTVFSPRTRHMNVQSFSVLFTRSNSLGMD